MKTYVIDIETDGLDATKIHVMSVGYKDSQGNWKVVSTDDYEKMRGIMLDPDVTVVGHNFVMFDNVVLERILDIKTRATIIDTLGLAWYIYPNRTKSFGLEAFGEDFGIKKPEVDDWENLSYDEYKYRCEQDVRINIPLWEDIKKKMTDVYGDWENAMRMVRYLMFKMECLKIQEQIKCKVDVEKVKENLAALEKLKEDKTAILIKAMPPGRIIKTKPKIMMKKDGTPSAHAIRWYDELREKGLSIDAEEIREDAKPTSHQQVKDWLFSLGWKPCHFNEGANGKVPQISDDDKNLYDSVKKLAEKEPAINELEGLSVILHRIGMLKGFLDSVDEDGYMVAGARGFTNTLRLRHRKPIANLPKVDRKAGLRDGSIIRECIVAPEGFELCGSDITSLEDNTKRHYMWKYDPDYVKDQMEENFDPHLDLAKRAGVITEEQAIEHVTGVKSYKDIRDKYKKANYSCIYGIGAPKLAGDIGISRREAKGLIQAYWDRNWSVKQLAKDTKVKTIDEQMWLFNPVNQFWYSLRNEKDIFSTLNQGTGSFIFDTWLKFIIDDHVFPFLQYHDEILALTRKAKGARRNMHQILRGAMKKVNEILKLNVEITVDVQFGNSYAEVH